MKYGNGSCQQYVGKPGEGKDTYIRKIVDLCPEKQVINFSTKPSIIRGKTYYDFKEFKQVAQAAEDTIIIMNELDSYLKPNPSAADTGIIHIQGRAREMNNLVIMVWHGWQQLGAWTIPNTYAIRRWDTIEPSWEPIYRRFAAIPPILDSLKKYPHLALHKSLYIPLR